MLATNTLSIKSPIVWQATLQPSKLFATLYWCALLLALIALWQCPLHWSVRALLIFVTFIGGIKIFQPTRQSSTLAFCENQSWQLTDQRKQHAGQLGSGSYRSMLLVVVAIKPADGLTQHAVIWRDSVSATQFSALHIRLAMTPIQQ